MTKISLTFYGRPTGPTQESQTVVVRTEQFNTFPIFNKITFEDKKKNPLNNIQFQVNNRNVAVVKPLTGGDIHYAEVFVLRSRDDTPLVYGINVSGKMQYYKDTEVLSDKTHQQVLSKSHNDLIDPLIDDNDDINNMVTFRIDQTNEYNHIDMLTKSIGSYFSEHTHTPKEKYKGRKTIVINKFDNVQARVPISGGLPSLQNNTFDKITVYFNQSGLHTDVPLLFRVTKGGEDYFYERRSIYEKRWRQTEVPNWQKIEKLENKLERINNLLFSSIIVLIHKQSEYKKFTIEDSKPTNPAPPDSKNINVIQHDCPLIGNEYVYFTHDLSVYKDSGQQRLHTGQYGFGFKSIKEMVVYIFNVGIKTSMKIPGGFDSLIKSATMGASDEEENQDPSDSADSPADPSSDDDDEVPLIYTDKCNQLNVYFYKNNKEIDNIPLMLQYYQHWFKPTNINDYFVEWAKVVELNDADPCNPYHAPNIKKHLDEIHKMVNRVNLNFRISDKNKLGVSSKDTHRSDSSGGPSKGKQGPSGSQGTMGTTTTKIFMDKYGIPAPLYLNKSYDVTRINVKCELFANDPMISLYTHETKNGSNIGVTYYRTNEKDNQVSPESNAMTHKSKPMGGRDSHNGGPRSQKLTQPFTNSKTPQPASSIGPAALNQGPDYTDPYSLYYEDSYIHGIEKDLDGTVDVSARSVTSYFFNEDPNNDYPLVVEYNLGNNKYNYYVLKHLGTRIR